MVCECGRFFFSSCERRERTSERSERVSSATPRNEEFPLPSSPWPVVPFAIGLMAVARRDLSRVELSVIPSPHLSRPEIEDVQLDNHPDGL